MKQQKFWQIAAITLAGLMIFYVNIGPMPGGDFWLQAKIGSLIVANRAIPETMLFPFTEMSMEPFHSHEWLASILFHGLLYLFDEKNIPLILGFFGLIFFSVVCTLAHARGVKNISVVLILGFIAVLGEKERHTLRPELVSLILMVSYWVFLELFNSKQKLVYGLTAVMLCILWVNCHGSFILGPLLSAAYAVGTYIDQLLVTKDFWRPNRKTCSLIALALASIFACLVNPSGVQLLLFVVDFGSHNNLGELLGEWTPSLDSRLWNYRGLWIAFSFWIVTLSALVFYRKAVSAVELLVFLGFTLLEIKAIRFTVYSGLICSYILAGRISKARLHPQISTTLNRAISVCAPLIMAYSLTYGGGLGSPQFASSIPTKLTDQMVAAASDSMRQGNVLTMSMYGSELTYRAWPRLKPSIDDRLDTYGLDYMNYQHALLSNDSLLDEFVERYDVHYILVSRLVFIEIFQHTKNWVRGRWSIVLLDDKTAFLRRSDISY